MMAIYQRSTGEQSPTMSTRDPLVDRAIRLFRFLARAQQLKSKPVRTTESYLRDGAVHWIGDVPSHRAVHVAHRDGDPSTDGHLLSLDRVDRIEPPPAPKVLRQWLKGYSEKATTTPELLASIANGMEFDKESASFVERREKLEERPDVTASFDDWMDRWRPWAERERLDSPVRDYYARLFASFVKATSHTEELELVLGVGLLAWRPTDTHPPVRRHAFSAPVIATMDDASGRLDFAIDTSAVGLASELDMLDPGVIPRRVTIQDAYQRAEGFGAHPFERSEFAELAKTLVNNIDAEGRYEDTTSLLAPGDEAVVVWSPALILRPRSQRGLVQVFETIARQIDEGHEVPVGLRPLLDPDQVPATVSDATPGALLEVDGEIFSPLPLNAVQRQIIERVDSNAQTLVQGPPGTGKTHTAAALLSHLLAQGKRVLVTAHTDRALQEVRVKLPERIKPLAVSVIGASRSDLAELKLAVDTISRRSTDHNPEESAEEIADLLKSVEKLRRRRQQLGAQLVSARTSDVEPRQHGTYVGTLARIAQTIEQQRDALGWISEFVEFDAGSTPPLTDAEAQTWLTLLRDQTLSTDAPDSARRLLDVRVIPEPEEFERLIADRSLAQTERSGHSDLLTHEASASVQALSQDERAALQSRMRSIVRQFDALQQMRAEWVRSALSDVRRGMPQMWLERAETIRSLLGDARRRIDDVPVGMQVYYPADSGPLVALAAHVRPHLESNGPAKTNPDGSVKIGMFTSSVIKQSRAFFEQVRVNGQPPNSVAAVDQFLAHTDSERLLSELDHAWPAGIIVPVEDTVRERASWHQSQLDQLDRVLALGETLAAEEGFLSGAGLSRPDWSDPDAVIMYARLVDAAAADDAWRRAEEPVSALKEAIRPTATWEDAAGCVRELAEAVENGDHESFARARSRLVRLHEVKKLLAERDALTARVAGPASRLASAVVDTVSEPQWTDRLARFEEAWGWGSVGAWIIAQDTTDVNDLQAQISTVEAQLRERAERVAALRAWNQAVASDRLTPRSRADLTQYSQLVRRLGKGTGKYAAQQRAEIRAAMDRCRPSVPVWIMPIYRIAEQLNISENMFDVVLVDEASQAGLEAVFLQYLSPKLVVIGDDKQVSPTAVGVDQGEIRELVEQYLHDDVYKASWLDPQRSLFDEAKMRFGGQLTLVEHRRCVPEIIGFSNRIAYEPDGIRLVPVRQFGADRLDPIKVIHLPDGYVEGSTGNRVNRIEVRALIDQIKECVTDPRYDGLTFGVISLLGSRQAQLIESQLLTELSTEDWSDRQLRVGDAADFQGSERDVMFLSMVSSITPGSRLAPMTREMYMQRYNVAVSRAKDQLWLFHSVSLGEIPNSDDLRHQLLDYCYGVVSRGRELADGESATVPDDSHVEPFDSLFEQRVYNRIVDRGFTVQPQFDASGYRIDLVVVGATARLAIECDGDTWHGPEAYERDLARQRDLERCGWQFFRVRESAFYVDPAEALSCLWELLEELEIRPPRWLTETSSDVESAQLIVEQLGAERTSDTSFPERAEATAGFASLAAQLDARLVELATDEVVGQEVAFAQASTSTLPTAVDQDLMGDDEEPGRISESYDEVDAENDGSRIVLPYKPFTGSVTPIGEATLADIAEGMVGIVRVEGPVTGARLHTVYVRASGGQRVGKQIAQELDRAISRAVQAGHLVEDNPLRQAGIKPKTYRLPWQPPVVPRELGGRDLDHVPAAELAEILRLADQLHGWASEGELFRHALQLLGRKALTEPARARLEQVLPLAFATHKAARLEHGRPARNAKDEQLAIDAPVSVLVGPAKASPSVAGERRFGRDPDEWRALVTRGIQILRETAAARSILTYSELNGRLADKSGIPTFDLSSEAGRHGLSLLLGDITRADHPTSGVMLSALVTFKGVGDVGRGFFSLAQEMGLLPRGAGTLDKESFWVTQVGRAHDKSQSWS